MALLPFSAVMGSRCFALYARRVSYLPPRSIRLRETHRTLVPKRSGTTEMPKRPLDPPESHDATTPPPGKRRRVAPERFEAGPATTSWSSVSQCPDPLQTPGRKHPISDGRIRAAARSAALTAREKQHLLQHLAQHPRKVLQQTQEALAYASGGADEALGEELVGAWIAVWWEKERTWYAGVVDRYYAAGRIHYIHYDDDDEYWETLDQLGERWRLLAPAPAPAHGGFAGRSQGDAGAPPAPPAPLGGLSSSSDDDDDDDDDDEIEHDGPEPQLRWQLELLDPYGRVPLWSMIWSRSRALLFECPMHDRSIICDDLPSGGWQPWTVVRGQSESPGGWTNLSSMVGPHLPDAAALSDMLPADSESCAQQV